MTFYTRFPAPLCEVILAGDEHGISHLHLCTGEGKRVFDISPEWVRNDAFFNDIARQVKEYMEGKRKRFDVRCNPSGTDFQKKVWRELTAIPYGELRTYGEIAKNIGNEKACRAVGMANSKNPIPLIVPCHRVVGTGGKLTGFAHGLTIKEQLIRLEKEMSTVSRW